MNQENDIQSCRRLLTEIAEMCEDASMTGSLSGGNRRTAHRFNTLLNRLVETGDLPAGLFETVPEDSTYAEIGVEARMLSSYFKSNKDKERRGDDNDRNVLIRLAPFVGKEELALLIRDQASKGGSIDMNTLTSLAPFLGQDILGEMLRANLSKQQTQKEPAEHRVKPQSPEAQEKPNYKLEPVSVNADSIDGLFDLLKSPYLSDEERENIIEKLRISTGRKG